ncbi:unnamed protein product [Urochloa humidicola]
MAGFRSLAPKTRNLVVAGGLSAFVLGVYYYTMRAVGGTDELQVAIDKFEEMKKKDVLERSQARYGPKAVSDPISRALIGGAQPTNG